MPTLSNPTLAALGLTVTRPGFLIQIEYSTILRLSTIGDVSWGGLLWAAADIRVSGLGQDGSAGCRTRATSGRSASHSAIRSAACS